MMLTAGDERFKSILFDQGRAVGISGNSLLDIHVFRIGVYGKW